MSVGPMQYGTDNSAGIDQTRLNSAIAKANFATLSVANTASSIIPGTHSALGIAAISLVGDAIYGKANADQGNGVKGETSGTTSSAIGVYGLGTGDSAIGVFGESTASTGSGVGVWGRSNHLAGLFQGPVLITGMLSKGGGGFKIDHPLDPENRYLQHSFVESPDALNVYSDNVDTDSDGYATVVLPEYFTALNKDFRYQLTVIGEFAQAIVAEEINNNQFTIKTDRPSMRVSWQVTGVRNDPFARLHSVLVEEEKPEVERGTYLHPNAYGRPASQCVE
jgi:hypothetical protein